MSSPLRVGFVSARSISRTDGALWVDAGVGRILDELAKRFAAVNVAMSLSPERGSLLDHRYEPRGAFVPLPYLPGVLRGLRERSGTRAGIAEVERQSDVVVVQLPFAAAPALLPAKTPRIYHVCADIVELVGSSPYYRGYKKWPARGLARSIDLFEAALIGSRRARLVANGLELHRRFGGADKGIAVVSATMLEREVMSARRRRPAGAPFRLLFVGYLRHEKGIDTLLESVEQLLSRTQQPLELAIVGAKEIEDRGMTDDVRKRVRALGRRMLVLFEGHKAFGPELFQAYADADLLVLPTLSEGTPRVLVEARAFGCPVVASRVGGIPTSVTDGVDGLLVPASDPAALTAALLRVITEPGLHARLADAGVARARRHTVEAFVGDLAAEIDRAARL